MVKKLPNKVTPSSLNFLNISFYFSITLVSLTLTVINLMNFLDNQKVLTVAAEGEVETLDVNNEDRRFWLNVIASHPTYRDAYIELAQIDYEQGRLKEAEAWLNKAYQIDPNSSVVASHFERMFKK